MSSLLKGRNCLKIFRSISVFCGARKVGRELDEPVRNFNVVWGSRGEVTEGRRIVERRLERLPKKLESLNQN
jgi:hypothetical protein